MFCNVYTVWAVGLCRAYFSIITELHEYFIGLYLDYENGAAKQ